MTSENRRTPSGSYAQNWSAYNAAQTNEKRHFLILLHELCQLINEPTQTIGRPRLSLGDMIFSAVFKVYSTFPARRFRGDLLEAQAKGLISKVPHFNSLSHYFQMESLTPILTELIETSSLPLKPFEKHFAVDATGLSTCRYARWLDEREMARARREWIKVHLVCGVKTNIVASVIITTKRANESPYFGRLVATAARNFKMTEVTGDKGYLAAENMRQALIQGVMPYFPFKSNSYLHAREKSTFWKEMLYMYRYRQPEFREHYNRRNNVETTFSMIKAKFGDRLRSKSQRAQFNEALCKVLCHNLCVLIQSMYELNIDPQFPSHDLSTEACNETSDKVIAEGRIIARIADPCREQETVKRFRKSRSGNSPQLNQDQLSLFDDTTV